MTLECFVLKSSLETLSGKTSTVFSLETRGEAPLRLYREDDGSERMIKVKIEEV